MYLLAFAVTTVLVGLSVWFIAGQFADLHAREVRRRERAERLSEMSELLASPYDSNYLLELALEQLSRIVPFDAAGAGLIEGGDFALRACRGPAGAQPAPPPRPLAELPAVGQLLRSHAPLLIDEAARSPLWPAGLLASATAPAAAEGTAAHDSGAGALVASWIGAPLIVHGGVIGAVMAESRTPEAFDQDDLSALALFAGHLAAALENARLYQLERERREELAALQQTLARIGAEPDRDVLLDHIAAEVARALRVPAVMVFVWDREERELVIGAQRGVSTEYALGQRLPRERVFAVFRRQGQEWRPLYLADLAHQTPGDAALVQREALRSELAVPLLAGGRLLGLLSLATRQDTQRLFTERDYEIVNLFAGQAAVALQNLGLRATERARAEEALALLELSQTLVSTRSLGAIYERVLALAESLTGALGGWVALYDNAASCLRLAAARGWPFGPLAQHPEAIVPWGSTWPSWQAFESQQIAASEDLEQEVLLPYRDAAYGAGVRRVLVLPLRAPRTSMGVLGLLLDDRRSVPGRGLLTTFANLTAAAIENAGLYSEVQDYARSLESKVAERTDALRRQKETMEATLHGVADAVIVIGADQPADFAVANPAAEQLVRRLGALERRELLALVERMSAHEDEGNTIALGGADWQVSVAALEDGGARIGSVAVLHDITRLRELDRLKSQFVSNVSHELRTPLTNIRLYLGLLRHGQADKHEQYLDVLEREATRLTRLIEDLLDLSRLEAGAVRLDLEVLDPDEVAADVVARLGALAHERGLQLTCRAAAEPLAVRADRAQLLQALINLVGNALNYTPSGGQVEVSVAPAVAEDIPCAVLAVADTGPGIAPAERSRIFERFYRGASASQGHAAGTGLGLAIVAEIARLHGGRVELDTEVGVGTTFRLLLPRVLATEVAV
jgi:signal transduction histidine kinase/putative methionine-R-sulfoxide reductase with GAF domain